MEFSFFLLFHYILPSNIFFTEIVFFNVEITIIDVRVKGINTSAVCLLQLLKEV
jgi:hypothetical protein